MCSLFLDDAGLREVPSAVAAILKHRRAELAKIDALPSDYYGPKWKAEKRSKVHQNAVDTLGELRQAASASSERILARARSRAQGPKPSDDARLAQAIEEQRIWGRFERQLSAGFSPEELVIQAAQSKDLTGLRVLKAELPSFIAAENGASPGGRQAARGLSGGILELIDVEIFPLLPQNEREALSTLSEVDAGMINVRAALAIADEELARFSPDAPSPVHSTLMPILPGWAHGEILEVEEA